MLISSISAQLGLLCSTGIPIVTTQVTSTVTLINLTPFVPFAPVTATGGLGTLTYSISPSLSSGLAFDSSTGTISGAPSLVNPNTVYTVTATDTIQTGSKTFQLMVTVVGASLLTAGTTSWTAPTGVTSVSVLVVGAGGYNASDTQGTGGGGGGALAYKNNITVVPGNSYTVIAGIYGNPGPGGSSSFTAGFGTITAGGGGGATTFNSSARSGAAGGQPSGTYDAGFAGGNGGSYTSGQGYGGGGGAAGYTGAGGNGGSNNGAGSAASTDSGGGGGGGSGSGQNGTKGGGVGLLGKGATGTGGSAGANDGGSGSGGASGYLGYGGGGTGWNGGFSQRGGLGAVRIIWPGHLRVFPSTMAGDLTTITPVLTVAVPSSSLSTGAVQSFSPITVTNGKSPYVYSVSPSLPTGLTLNMSTGVISGIPTTLSSSTTYTMSVYDSNFQIATGTGSFNIATIVPTGQVTFVGSGSTASTTQLVYTWTVPADVTSISVVAIGGGGGAKYKGDAVANNYSGGGGGGAGGLSYQNNIAVTPGTTLTVRVGNFAGLAGGGGSTDTTPASAGTGSSVYVGSTLVVNAAGGSGGWGKYYGYIGGAGGGGGATGDTWYSGGAGGTGSATSAGGGGQGASYTANGATGITGYISGSAQPPGSSLLGSNPGGGTLYGFGCSSTVDNNIYPRVGGTGAVRIMWPGNTRQYPSTNVGDLG